MPADPHPPDALLDELATIARDVATEAAGILLAGRARARASATTKSTGTDMVTEVDRASEALITSMLRAARPDDSILGEEGAAVEGTSGVRWIVDPVDGTTNYLYGHPPYAVSVAAAVGGTAVAGVVVDVAHGEVFEAVTGRGATLDGVPLRVTGASDLATALVGTGFAYDPAWRARQGAVLAHVLPLVRDVRRAGAASVDLCWVAAGRLDAYYERGLAPWDEAAGGLVAREAGALVTTLHGGPTLDDVVVAAPPHLHGALTTLLRDAGAA